MSDNVYNWFYMEKRRRKRFRIVRERLPPIEDRLAYYGNSSSFKARHDSVFDETISIEIWFDKHYLDRHQHGDENGVRDGIDPDYIRQLIREAIKPLFIFSSRIKGFSFVNGPPFRETIRAVIRKEFNGSKLNVVLQCCFKNAGCLEATVITAMVVDDFKLANGQYMVDLEEGEMVLSKFENGRLNEICKI